MDIFVEQVLPILLPVLSALGGLLVASFKLRRSAIEKKLYDIVDGEVVPDWSLYYIVIDDQKIDLSTLNIKKKVTLNEKKINEKKKRS